jgi:hypothetical protein
MRRTIPALATSLVTIAAYTVGIPTAGAADGTGLYGDWSFESTTQGIVSFTERMPNATVAITGGSGSRATGATIFLNANTPVGEQYGSSRQLSYASIGIGGSFTVPGNPSVTTITFDEVTPASGWSFVLGDIDAENVTIAALDDEDTELDVSDWFSGAFNYCNAGSPKPSGCPAGTSTDEPVWESPVIKGNAVDTSGAAAWFTPTAAVKTLILTQERNIAGGPSYQLWIASDLARDEVEEEAAPEAKPAEECTATDTRLANGGFELPVIPANTFRQVNQRDVPGWQTTATDGRIEIWSNGYGGVPAPEGEQFAELNATQASELFQVVETTPGQTLVWSLLHRARRAGTPGDTMSVNIGAPATPPNDTTTFSDTLDDGWVRHTGTYIVPEDQTETRFGFQAVSTASGNVTIGNFLDDIYFTTLACVPAEIAEEVEDELPKDEKDASEDGESGEKESEENDTKPEGDGSGQQPEDSTEDGSTDDNPDTGGAPEGSTSVVTPEEPIRTDPSGSTPIPVLELSGNDGGRVIDVAPPTNGTATVEGDTVVYQSNPGFYGTDEVTVTVIDRAGKTITVVIPVQVGQPQVAVNLKLPKRISLGLNTIVDGPVRTNAKQTASVSVTCGPILRTKPMGAGGTDCIVRRDNGRITLLVRADEPLRVTVRLSAPAKGDFAPYREIRRYTVG